MSISTNLRMALRRCDELVDELASVPGDESRDARETAKELRRAIVVMLFDEMKREAKSADT